MLRIKETQNLIAKNKRARVAESGLCNKLNRRKQNIKKKHTHKKKKNKGKKKNTYCNILPIQSYGVLYQAETHTRYMNVYIYIYERKKITCVLFFAARIHTSIYA